MLCGFIAKTSDWLNTYTDIEQIFLKKKALLARPIKLAFKILRGNSWISIRPQVLGVRSRTPCCKRSTCSTERHDIWQAFLVNQDRPKIWLKYRSNNCLKLFYIPVHAKSNLYIWPQQKDLIFFLSSCLGRLTIPTMIICWN